jgi:hypothetical protein
MTNPNKQSESRYSINRFDEYVEEYRQSLFYKDRIPHESPSGGGMGLGALFGYCIPAITWMCFDIKNHSSDSAGWMGFAGSIIMGIGFCILGGTLGYKLEIKAEEKPDNIMKFARKFDEINQLPKYGGLVYRLNQINDEKNGKQTN